ncbi:MAG TPA: hypothetical protein VFQ95_06120 [Rhodanobacteraceae bacterium]|nr:hypothetical protein [Rhodanobacteraceae bacterium]
MEPAAGAAVLDAAGAAAVLAAAGAEAGAAAVLAGAAAVEPLAGCDDELPFCPHAAKPTAVSAHKPAHIVPFTYLFMTHLL